jgi:type IV pilus assembly protein PilB
LSESEEDHIVQSAVAREHAADTPAEQTAVIAPGRAPGRPRIGEMMIERGLIKQSHLDQALQHQRETGQRMGETLVEMGVLSPVDLVRVLAECLGYDFIDLSVDAFDILVANRIPEEAARRYRALPIKETDGQIFVAMASPDDVFALDDVRLLTESSVVAVMAEATQLLEAIDRAYARSDIEASVDDAVSEAEERQAIESLVSVGGDAPIVRLVNALLERAVDERASDVHIEPLSTRVRIRSRIDGVLRDASEVPPPVLAALVSRLKVMAGIDITRTRVPNDGRFSMKVRDHSVDVRVATVPTAHGEAVILRLLNHTRGVMDLASIGFLPDELERYRQAYEAAQGTILVTGPTGSGKTSTLYATLIEVNTDEVAAVSVEDPVEYKIDGVKQIQINPRAGLTFPVALRAILRCDPNIVLVGEIRDHETAKIAAEAALTGHLVLSTLHTTSAAATPLRLIDMGLEPYLVSSAITCVVAQRLARKLCEACAEPDARAAQVLRGLGVPDEIIESGTLRKPVGCNTCHRSGYRGRTAIYEIMPMTEDISRLVIAGASSREIERWAVAEGMDTLRMSATRRLAAGAFGVDELMRVVT